MFRSRDWLNKYASWLKISFMRFSDRPKPVENEMSKEDPVVVEQYGKSLPQTHSGGLVILYYVKLR